MFDASTKVPSGVFNFVAFDLGNFDECYNLEEVINDETVYGKYCLGTIPIPKDMMMKVRHKLHELVSSTYCFLLF